MIQPLLKRNRAPILIGLHVGPPIQCLLDWMGLNNTYIAVFFKRFL